MNEKIIESWVTFKKRENPTIYSVRDSSKGWIKETIQPTMQKLGWCVNLFCDYGIEKPKRIASGIVDELCKRSTVDSSHFVYSFTKGKNGYMDCVQVFYKAKNR